MSAQRRIYDAVESLLITWRDLKGISKDEIPMDLEDDIKKLEEVYNRDIEFHYEALRGEC